ncbi:hypothetical protein ACLOJK_024579 [Asimina triloba]
MPHTIAATYVTGNRALRRNQSTTEESHVICRKHLWHQAWVLEGFLWLMWRNATGYVDNLGGAPHTHYYPKHDEIMKLLSQTKGPKLLSWCVVTKADVGTYCGGVGESDQNLYLSKSSCFSLSAKDTSAGAGACAIKGKLGWAAARGLAGARPLMSWPAARPGRNKCRSWAGETGFNLYRPVTWKVDGHPLARPRIDLMQKRGGGMHFSLVDF